MAVFESYVVNLKYNFCKKISACFNDCFNHVSMSHAQDAVI